MTTLTIRKKLTNYLQVSDENKVKAIYTLLEHDIKENGTATIEGYNKEIDESLAQASTGNYITQAEMEKQAATW
ncbi:MAG: hypothetical protein ACKVOM_07425 [Ferruginibacter sp.]